MKSLHLLLSRLGKVVGGNKLSTLIYHQVEKAPDPMRPSNPDAAAFRWQMSLMREHFNPVSLDDAVQYLQRGDLPPNSICVTFDDGYLNNLEVAQPILAEFNIPATVFVATGFRNGFNMWNDRLIDLIGNTEYTSFDLDVLDMGTRSVTDVPSRIALVNKILPDLKYREFRHRADIIDTLYLKHNAPEAPRKMMSDNDIIQLSQKGVDIGAHTVDHPILKSMSKEEQRHQVGESKNVLEKLTGKAVNGFAYPNGRPGIDYDETTLEMVREAGFNYAVSTSWGISTRDTNRFELNRFTPWDLGPGKFHLRMMRNIMEV